MGGSAKLYGQAGSDRLKDWGEGKGWLYGGPSADRLIAYFGVGKPDAADYLDGGDGLDKANANREDAVTTTEATTWLTESDGCTLCG
jgi:hypothetical protein